MSFIEELPAADDIVEVIINNIRLGGICYFFKVYFARGGVGPCRPYIAVRCFFRAGRASDVSADVPLSSRRST